MKVCSDLDSLFRHIVSEESINSVLLLFLYNLDAGLCALPCQCIGDSR